MVVWCGVHGDVLGFARMRVKGALIHSLLVSPNNESGFGVTIILTTSQY